MDTSKLIKEFQSEIHQHCGHERGSVKAHVYTEGFLLALVAELCYDDSKNWAKVRRKISNLKYKPLDGVK